MIKHPDISPSLKFVKLARVSVLSALLISSIQFIGVSFEIDFLKSPLLHPMNVTTAIGVMMLGIAFMLSVPKSDSMLLKSISTSFIVFVLLSSVYRFLVYVLRYKVALPVISERETISTGTTLCGALTGVVWLLLNSKNLRNVLISQYIASAIFLSALFSLFINSYHAHSFAGIFKVPMSPYSAVCYLLFSIAALFTNPERGLMKELTMSYAGSLMARRLIPVAIVLPFLYGFARLYGEWAGFYNAAFGTALAVLIGTITCIVFIMYTATLLNKRDILNDQSKLELREANYFLDTVLENIPNMVFVKDAKDLRFVRFNRAGEEFLGYSRNDLIGKNDYDFFPKEQADFFTEKDREVLSGDLMVDVAEEPIITKSGERWLHTKKIPVRNQNGVPLYLVGVSEDITERKKKDEELRQLNAELERKVEERTEELAKRELRFRKLLENNFEIIVLVDKNTQPIYRSPASERMTGWSNDERRKEGGPMDDTHPDDRDKMKATIQELKKNPGKPFPVSFRTRHKDGHYIWLEGFMTNMFHDESLKGVLGNFRDVTERKEAEQKLMQSYKDLSDYRFALDESSIITITDQKGVIKYANDNFCKISKYTEAELIGRDHRLVNSGFHPKDFMGDLWMTISSGKIWRGEIKNKAKDGSFYWVNTTIVPFLNEEGKPYQYLALRQDITKKKHAEEEINQLTNDLRELLKHIQTSREEERKYIAREIHDELGSALTALKIDVSMLQKKVSKELEAGGDSQLPTPDYVANEFNSIINQLDSSINSVKKISTDLRPEILDHLGIIEAVNWRVQQFENITGIPCKVWYLPEAMNLDKELSTAVYRTVQEALTNIARHAKASLVDIRIEQSATNISIEIKDDGKGIKEGELNSNKSLGLIGMRERIRLLNGHLLITGNEGKGTTVSATIPVK